MTRLYTNNYTTQLNGAITNVATTMTVNSVTGLPAIGSGETCQLTIADGINIEIVTATSVSGLIITMTRGQEGTSGTAFGNSANVELRATALSFIDPAGVIDFGAATSLEIPNGAAPTVDAAGEIAVDTTITDYTGMIKYYDGVEELTVAGLPTANLSTTDGDVIQYDAAANELTMAPPILDYEFISSQTASSSAQVDFTGLSTVYRDFKIILSDILPATDSVAFYIRTSTDNGSTYDSAATDYAHGRSWVDMAVTPTVGSGGDNSDSEMEIAGDVSNAATETLSGMVYLHNPQGTAFTAVSWETVYITGTGGVGLVLRGGGFRTAAEDVDAIRFLMSSGNIASGTFSLYGIRKA